MKHFFIYLLLSVSSICVSGQTIIPFCKGADTSYAKAPIINKKQNSNTATFTLTFENAKLHPDTINGEIYHHVEISETGLWFKEGQPKLPALYPYIPITSKNIEVKLVSADYIEYDNVDIIPSQHLPLLSDTILSIPFACDNYIYASNQYFPKEIIGMQSVQEYKGNLLARLKIFPIQYNPVLHRIRCYSKIEYAIDHVDERKPKTNNAWQYQDDYFMVCKDNAVDSLYNFVKWKKQQGFHVQIIHKDNWSNYSEVWDSIQSHYEQCNPSSRKFLLIVGDHSMVPARVELNGYNQFKYVTDYNYACMDSLYDIIPDIAVGRIPCSDLSELCPILTKIVQYQKYPVFENKSINVGYFEVSAPTATAEIGRSIRTCEDIRNHIITNGFNCQRIYLADSMVNPKRYSSIYSDGSSLPTDLLRPSFVWNGSANDIVSGFNNNPNIVLYCGHGNSTSWENINFSISDLALLNNTLYPIVLNSACLTGQYAYVLNSANIISRDCLAYRMLKNNAGAAAVIAATHKLIKGYDDLWTAGWYNTIFPNPKIHIKVGNFDYLYFDNQTFEFAFYANDFTIGNAINAASHSLANCFEDYNKFVKHTNNLHHCFGDPSTELYTGTPEDLSVVDVKQINDSIIINTNTIQNCKVLLIPKDESQSDLFMMADSITGRYVFPNIKVPYNISVQKHNCALKYIESYDIYLQNFEFNDATYHYEGRNVYIGKNVTNEAPQGNVIVKPNAHLTVKGTQSVQTTDNFEVKSGGTFNIIR